MNPKTTILCGALSATSGICYANLMPVWYSAHEPLLMLDMALGAITFIPLGLYLVGTGIAEEVSEKMIEKMGNPVYPVPALDERDGIEARFSGTDLSPGFSGNGLYASESGKDEPEPYLTAYR